MSLLSFCFSCKNKSKEKLSWPSSLKILNDTLRYTKWYHFHSLHPSTPQQNTDWKFFEDYFKRKQKELAVLRFGRTGHSIPISLTRMLMRLPCCSRQKTKVIHCSSVRFVAIKCTMKRFAIFYLLYRLCSSSDSQAVKTSMCWRISIKGTLKPRLLQRTPIDFNYVIEHYISKGFFIH